VLLNYHICRFVLGSLCVGDLVQLGLSSLSSISTAHSQATDDGYINVRNILST